MRGRLTVALCLLAASAAAADEVALPDTAVLALPTAANGVDYELYVYAPRACRETARLCPAVYLLDAEYSFPLAATIVDHLAARDRIEPAIAVSIAYKDKTQYRLNRTRDYTPFRAKDGGYGEEFQKVSGGGAAFLGVIAEEIIPAVERLYGPAQRRALVGHSYGGLFAAYAFSARPDLFNDYVFVSPSLWYADGKLVKDIERRCAKGDQAKPARAVLEVGAHEEQPENGRAMVSDLARLDAILKSCATRKVDTYFRVFEDETHASVFPAALSTGLRRLLAP